MVVAWRRRRHQPRNRHCPLVALSAHDFAQLLSSSPGALRRFASACSFSRSRHPPVLWMILRHSSHFGCKLSPSLLLKGVRAGPHSLAFGSLGYNEFNNELFERMSLRNSRKNYLTSTLTPDRSFGIWLPARRYSAGTCFSLVRWWYLESPDTPRASEGPGVRNARVVGGVIHPATLFTAPGPPHTSPSPSEGGGYDSRYMLLRPRLWGLKRQGLLGAFRGMSLVFYFLTCSLIRIMD